MAYKPAVRETEQCMETAREEAGLGAPDTLAFQCKHPANREYALFFMHMTDAAEIRSLDNGADSQWPKTLRKITGSLCKLPTRVRSLDHANAIHGVGAKTLELFRKYLTKYPPEPPSEAELLADERATEATRAAKETEKARKKRERDAKKTAAKPAPAAKPGTPNESQQQRNRYDPRGVDDDVIALDMDNTPPDAQNRNQNRPPAAEPPPAKKSKKKPPAKKPSRWEPGYRTAPFALLVTLHRLSLQGVVTTDKKTLMDEAEESDLSQQGIYPKGNADIAAAAAGGARGYRGDKAQFSYSGWTCFGKQLKVAPKGWPAPMVMCWSVPMQIRLTDEGKMLGSWLHAAAEQRGDCVCGLMSASDIAAANLEREAVLMGGEAGGGGATGGASGSGSDAPVPPGPIDTPVVRAAARPNTETFADEAPEPRRQKQQQQPPVNDATLRRERARAATLEEIARVRAAARAETMPAGAMGTLNGNTTIGTAATPGDHAAAAAERRRVAERAIDAAAELRRSGERDRETRCLSSAATKATREDAPLEFTRRPPPQPSASPMDDDIVILSDDEDDAAPFRDDNARFVDDFVARSGNRQREHPAMSTCSGRQLRLPPFPRGVAFKDVYDVVLIVDNREQFGGARRGANQTRADHRQEEVQRIASTHGILAEVGHLECGDATWVARRKPHHPGPQNDFVLDFVVERKSLDDLRISIQDDRYRQQKFFLKKSGVRSLGYLVEGDVSKWSSSFGVAEQSVKAVGSATVQTEVWDGFSVIRTEHQKETFETYGRMTVAMTDLYGSLTSSDGAKPALCSSGDTTDHLPIPLQEYNARLTNTKRSLSTLRNVWGGMLMAVPGLGPEIAQGIIDKYPTPFSLNMAYGKCASKETASALLQSLPLTGNRTVGPLVSKKVFTSLFGHELTPRA